jgi:hypothetical protein
MIDADTFRIRLLDWLYEEQSDRPVQASNLSAGTRRAARSRGTSSLTVVASSGALS